MVGIGTALADDPLLTPRPLGKRSPVRIVVDSSAQLPLDSKLVTTTHEHPCLVAVGPQAEEDRCKKLESRGCEIWRGTSDAPNERLKQLMTALADRGMTNILVEGGGRLLGSLFDQKMICEAHAFIAPKIVGGSDAIPPISGTGIDQLADSVGFSQTHIENLDGDIHLWGRLIR